MAQKFACRGFGIQFMNEFFATISSVNRFSVFSHILVHFPMLSVCFFFTFCFVQTLISSGENGQPVISQLRKCANPHSPLTLRIYLSTPLTTWRSQKDTFALGILLCPHVSCFMFLVSLLSFFLLLRYTLHPYEIGPKVFIITSWLSLRCC